MIEMDRTLAWWREHLDSAFRTTIACAIVDYTTLYAPASLRKLLTYPAYSYLTTILIVLEATLGDSLSGFWHALYASIQVVILSTISLWVIGPTRLNYAVATAFYGNYILAAAGVALSAFVVALPKSTPLRSKQIAFGQLVIVYVGTVVHGAQTWVVMHPVHVASNTILGALASVLAMLLPYPKLAFHKVYHGLYIYIHTKNFVRDHCLYIHSLVGVPKERTINIIKSNYFLTPHFHIIKTLDIYLQFIEVVVYNL